MNNLKIQQLVEKIVSDQEKIQSVRKSDDAPSGSEEFYFTYPDDKYLWSVLKDSEGAHWLYYYPNRDDHSEFMRIGEEGFSITHGDKLQEVFAIARSKLFGFDNVLKDILGE